MQVYGHGNNLLYTKVAARTEWESKYSYGWQRAEVLGALINGVFLLALCFTLLIECIKRFINTQEITEPVWVLITGSAGLVANLIGLFLFHGMPKLMLHWDCWPAVKS